MLFDSQCYILIASVLHIKNDISVTEYDYDLNSQVTSVDYSNGRTQSYYYNDIGALISSTVTNTSNQNASNSYEYYLDGKMATDVSTIDGLKTYEYDGMNRIKKRQ